MQFVEAASRRCGNPAKFIFRPSVRPGYLPALLCLTHNLTAEMDDAELEQVRIFATILAGNTHGP